MQPRIIQDTINQLNSFEIRTGGTGIWQAIDGVQALTTVTRSSGQSVGGLVGNQAAEVNFQIGSGVLVKSFINSQTGEIKIFPAKLFGYPEQNI